MARSYSDETKAAAMAALLQGQSVSAVAEEYEVPRGTVAGWSSKVRKTGVSAVSNTKKGEIGDLLTRYLTANLRALEAQAELFSDRDWLKKQTAEAAAVLHGVMTDKAVRLIEAFGKIEEGDDSD